MNVNNTIKKGAAAEQKACSYLVKQGLKEHSRNYQCPMGEIDLIMWDGLCLVFVEVRSRKSCRFGGAGASITLKKQQKIIKTTLYFLMVKKLQDKYPIRFDVVTLDGDLPEISWIKNAFYAK